MKTIYFVPIHASRVVSHAPVGAYVASRASFAKPHFIQSFMKKSAVKDDDDMVKD